MTAADSRPCERSEQENQDEAAAFTQALLSATRSRKSWRERLQWIRDRFADSAFAPGPEQLATVAVYLRLLATGELKCEEDGRHFRPNHHAEAALQIESALERLTTPQTAWILRRIYPYLPSWGDEFRRSEPLTRIRDIAHRNDIPPDLKREIKHRLQNKLHRCAGPEDLRTSEELLARVTAPGAEYSPGFVQEFRIFHSELLEFFNATDLEKRLQTLASSAGAALAEAVRAYLSAKESRSGAPPLALLERLTALRQQLAAQLDQLTPQQRSQVRLADIGLEDHAFALLSEVINNLGDLPESAWPTFLGTLLATLDNLQLSHIDSEECAALRSELSVWANGFSVNNRFHLLRLLASLGRARRLAEAYADRINRLFPPRVEELGRALGIEEHAIRVFSEGDIRGHVVFQLSKLVDLGLQTLRQALALPPWEAIVPGEALATLVRAADLAEVEGQSEPLVLLLERAEGDAEIPAAVKGIALGHPLPHLSHLGVRARQMRIPFAACSSREHLGDFEHLVGRCVRLRVTPEGLTLQPGEGSQPAETTATTSVTLSVPEVILTHEPVVLPLEQARRETCGAKAASAQRLWELAARSNGLFRAPRGVALPFGVMEYCLDSVPEVRQEYLALQERLPTTPPAEVEALLRRLRELVRAIPVPPEIGQVVASCLGSETRLAVRSSANGEDLEHLAGAGLYDSVINVPVAQISQAIARVWASLWTRRATLSRQQAGIPHAQLHMAVLVQELVRPDLSFILHTANPLTGDRSEVLVELAVGLGEVLASSSVAGTPYRLACRLGRGTKRLACANFSLALRPAEAAEGLVEERLDYGRISLSTDESRADWLGERLARVAAFLHDELGRAQDVEGVCCGDEIYLVQTRPQQGL